MADSRRETLVPTHFDDETLEHDLARLPQTARLALRELRRDIKRAGGLPLSHLKGCQSEGRDGTNLAGCVKTYVPWPEGRYGLVLTAVEHPTRSWALRAIALGVRHPPRDANVPTVYQIAHGRLLEWSDPTTR